MELPEGYAVIRNVDTGKYAVRTPIIKVSSTTFDTYDSAYRVLCSIASTHDEVRWEVVNEPA